MYIDKKEIERIKKELKTRENHKNFEYYIKVMESLSKK